jgi:hypothetical protein
VFGHDFSDFQGMSFKIDTVYAISILHATKVTCKTEALAPLGHCAKSATLTAETLLSVFRLRQKIFLRKRDCSVSSAPQIGKIPKPLSIVSAVRIWLSFSNCFKF